MKKLIFAIVVFCNLPLGCATLAEQAKMEEFGRTMDSYETAMRLSDFHSICQYVISSEMAHKDCLARYDNMKIVTYDIIAMSLAEDNQEVTQTVEVEYYFLDRYIAKKLKYEQSWDYQEDLKTWMLKAGPPVFE